MPIFCQRETLCHSAEPRLFCAASLSDTIQLGSSCEQPTHGTARELQQDSESKLTNNINESLMLVADSWLTLLSLHYSCGRKMILTAAALSNHYSIQRSLIYSSRNNRCVWRNITDLIELCKLVNGFLALHWINSFADQLEHSNQRSVKITAAMQMSKNHCNCNTCIRFSSYSYCWPLEQFVGK